MHRTAMLLSLLTIACSSRREQITAQGTIEVDETDIVPTVRGRISRLWVAEGDWVRGEIRWSRWSPPRLPDDLHEREARVARAEAELRELERRRPARGDSPAPRRSCEARRQKTSRADADLERMEALIADDVVSQQDVDQARAEAGEARGRKEASEQTLRCCGTGRPGRRWTPRAHGWRRRRRSWPRATRPTAS